MNVIVQAICIAIVLNIVCEGVGNFILKITGTTKRGYASPIGLVSIFTILEILYLPSLCLHLGSTYSSIVTMLVAIVACFIAILHMKDCFRSIVQRDTIAVIASSVLYVLILLHTRSANDFELLEQVSTFSYSSTIDLQEFYLQGYIVLQAMLLRVISKETLVMFIGILYHMFFAQVCLNIIRTFKLKNPWFVFTLVLYAVFYTGFNEWQIINAYMGDNWRILFISIFLWQIYCDIQEEQKHNTLILSAIIVAGMFVTNGFATITVCILYCYLAWRARHRKLHTLQDFLYLLFPQLIYSCLCISRVNMILAICLFIAYLLVLIFKNKSKLRRLLARIEDKLFDHAIHIFYIGIPLITFVATLLLWIWDRNALPYSLYKQFLELEPVRSYLFLDHSMITIVLDIIRWIGVIIFIYFSKKKEELQLRSMFFLMLILFLNPLSMGTIARLIGIEAYAFIFEILFNPFTDLLLFISVYRMFEWQIIGQWVLEIFLVLAVFFGHISSFTNIPFGLYENLIPSGHIQEIE